MPSISRKIPVDIFRYNLIQNPLRSEVLIQETLDSVAPEQIHPYKKWNIYTHRFPVCGSRMNIWLIEWDHLSKSPVHRHCSGGCLLKILQGHVMETRYPRVHSGLYDSNCPGILNLFSAGDVSFIHDDLATHSIENIYPEVAYTLHFYLFPRGD